MQILFKLVIVGFALLGMKLILPGYFPALLGIATVVGGFHITYMICIMAATGIASLKLLGKG